MKSLLASLVILASSSAFADTFYSNVSKVKSIDFSVNGGLLRIQLESMTGNVDCPDHERYLLDPNARMFDETYQMLLVAKSKGQKVEFKFRTCQEYSNYSYPKIEAIYFCNSHACN